MSSVEYSVVGVLESKIAIVLLFGLRYTTSVTVGLFGSNEFIW